MPQTNDEILQQLVEAGDKATQGEWDCMNETLDTPYVTSMFAGLNDICDLYHKSPDGKVHTKDNAKANANFIAQAANARLALKEHLVYTKKLEEALRFYGDKNNWAESGEDYVKRLWLEPDSSTPTAYNGYELAKQALAGKDE